jgi:hypothetical protein
MEVRRGLVDAPKLRDIEAVEHLIPADRFHGLDVGQDSAGVARFENDARSVGQVDRDLRVGRSRFGRCRRLGGKPSGGGFETTTLSDEGLVEPSKGGKMRFSTPYARYFLSLVLQFQFHRALAKAAGCTTALHRCSIYESAAAGERLRKTLALGAFKPWQDALEALTGEREMDASAMADYFASLKTWLDQQNQGRKAGW